MKLTWFGDLNFSKVHPIIPQHNAFPHTQYSLHILYWQHELLLM